MKYRKALLVMSAVALVLVGTIGSFSYFSDRGSMTNNLSTGSLDLEETETLWDDGVDGKNMYPGYTVDKNPTVQNITAIPDNDAYIKATIRLKDKDGNMITDQNRCNLIMHTIRYDKDNQLLQGTKYSDTAVTSRPNVNPEFTLRSDIGGEYVYFLMRTLKSSDTAADGQSVTLFNKIVYPTEWSQTELDVIGNYQIEIEFEGIQASSFDSVDAAMNALAEENVHVDYTYDGTNR